MRLQHQLRQVDFARRLGVSPATVGSWEVGTRSPSARHRARLTAEFGIRFAESTRRPRARASSPARPTEPGTATITHGDAWTLAARLRPGSVNAVVTSPPYFKQRVYHRGRREFGQTTIRDYVAELVTLFDRLAPALAPDAACWLNIGDTVERGQYLFVPARVALGLQRRGWLLRSEVIFERTNIAPEAAASRPTRSHEHVFLLSRTPTHFYDAAYMREPSKYAGYVYERTPRAYDDGRRYVSGNTVVNPTRNLRSVWVGATGWNAQVQHPAMMPRLMAERCVLSITKPGGLVLDPFAGSGTTGRIAVEHGRNFLGWDLSRAYVRAMRERLST